MCCSSWGRKESDMTEKLTELKETSMLLSSYKVGFHLILNDEASFEKEFVIILIL